MADKFLIAPYKEGVQKDMPTWLIPQKAFTRLNNAYVHKGRVKKRFGAQLTGGGVQDHIKNLKSRLRIKIGTTDENGDLSGSLDFDLTGFDEIGQIFSIGSVIYTIHQVGSPADMLATDDTATATYANDTGDYVFVGAPENQDVFFYPCHPVMGFVNYEAGSVSQYTAIAFDKHYPYIYDGNSWLADTSVKWNGKNSDFFWSVNWRSTELENISIFTSNFNYTTGAPLADDDPIRFYNGTTWGNFSNYTKFNNDQDIIISAKIIMPFNNRLLLFNVVEQDISELQNTHFASRICYSHIRSPFDGSAWLRHNQEYVSGGVTYKYSGGGYIDAPVGQEIVSAAIVKDSLIVYFERSTYELSYTGNDAIPFVFREISQTQGSESTFSTVGFDTNIITVSTTGINSCNGTITRRIDTKIPEKVYEIPPTIEDTKSVCGVKDHFNNLVYWSYLKKTHSDENAFNDTVIVYNYETGSWGFNDDCINSFGHLEESPILSQAASHKVVCGNHKGFIFVVDTNKGSNCQSQHITNMTEEIGIGIIVVPNHNLRRGDYVKIEHVQGFTNWSDGIYRVSDRFDKDEFAIVIEHDLDGSYQGGGLITLVSKPEIETKPLNPYIKNGDNIYLLDVNFNVDKTPSGEITVEYSTSTSDLKMADESDETDTQLGNNILSTSVHVDPDTLVPIDPLEEFQSKLWHKVFFQAYGEFVKLKLRLTNEQMTNSQIAESMFTLNGMILHTKKG